MANSASDAGNSEYEIDRAHRKFSDEQIKNLGIISTILLRS